MSKGVKMGPQNKMWPGIPEKPKSTAKTIKRLWIYLNNRKIGLMLVTLSIVASTAAAIAGTRLIGIAIDKYIITGDLNGLAYVCAVLLLVYIFGAVFTWLQNIFMIKIAQETVFEIRKEIFDKLQMLPMKFIDSKTHGELMSRVTNDVDNISNALSQGLTQIFSSIISVTGTFAVMLTMSPVLTCFALLTMPLLFFITKTIAGRSRKYFSKQQKRIGELNGYIEEIISGQKVVKIFTREEKEKEKFSKLNHDLSEVGIKAQVFSSLIHPVLIALNNLGYAVVVAAGACLIIKKVMTVGDLTSFMTYAKQFNRPLSELANQVNFFQSAIAGAERIFEIMDEPQEEADGGDAVEISGDIGGKVALEHVNFSYVEGNPVLKDINLYAKPGQSIALVGPTGAGKTTIVNLLTRFYDIADGEISIDGRNIKDIKKESLQKTLGIVLQDTFLFTGSIKDNIRYGNLRADDNEIIEASKLANAHEFIRRLPKGYDTPVGESGSSLSQGQRQMISIARTILKNPSLLILDEATSNIDTRTEIKIQQAMDNLMRGRTSFVIAHRLSTIKNANLIAVINNGEIIERGDHEELLAKKGFYYNLYMSQFSQ